MTTIWMKMVGSHKVSKMSNKKFEKTLNAVNKQKNLMWIAVIVLAIAIPVTLYLVSRFTDIAIEFDFLMTCVVLLAGCLYELYSPWINKLMEYKRLAEEAMKKDEKPPDPDEFFKHGTSFNKVFYLITAISLIVAIGVMFYMLSSGTVKFDNWIANAVFNFSYAVGQTKLIKERLL